MRKVQSRGALRVGATAAGILSSVGLGTAVSMIADGRHAAATHSLAITIMGFADGDMVTNYDFNDHNVADTNADWPAATLFRGNATYDGLKTIFQGSNIAGYNWYNLGGDKSGYEKDASALGWDDNKGLKTSDASCPDDYHMRFYKNGNLGYMQNHVDGKYVFASDHIDHHDGCAGQYYGYSEDVEGIIAQGFRDKCYTVNEDCCDWFNPEPLRADGNHYWQNNGLATIIDIP